MMFFKKKQPEKLSTFIPIRKVKEFNESEGKITLLIPKFKSEGIRKWLVPKHKSAHIKIHLDETGSNVWRLIDDHTTVEGISNQLRSLLESQEKPSELLEERVTKYLTQLYKARLLSLKNDLECVFQIAKKDRQVESCRSFFYSYDSYSLVTCVRSKAVLANFGSGLSEMVNMRSLKSLS